MGSVGGLGLALWGGLVLWDLDRRPLGGNGGAAVSFLAPLSVEAAEDWWRSALASEAPRSVHLVARDAEGLVGSVQVLAAWAPNQPHRGELVKLLVHRRRHRQGIAGRLMQAAEAKASEAGLSMLTLDAKRGEAAEQLYRKLGWTHVGTFPDFALDPDGETPHDAVLYYKRLGSASDTAGPEGSS